MTYVKAMKEPANAPGWQGLFDVKKKEPAKAAAAIAVAARLALS